MSIEQTAAESPPRARSRFLFGVALLAFLADAAIFYLLNPRYGPTIQYLARATAASLIASALVLSDRIPMERLGFALRGFGGDLRWLLKVAAALLGVSAVLMAAAVAILRLVEPPLSRWPLETQAPGWFLNSVLLAPLVEETVYRSLMMPGLVEAYGKRGAIVAGSAVFFALHLMYGQPAWMVHYVVAGAILSWAYVRREKLWICAALHAGGNLLVVVDDALLAWAPETFRALVGGLPPGAP